MNLIENKLIEKSHNSEFNGCVLKFEFSFLVNKKLYYPFVHKNYIYYRDDLGNSPKPQHEVTKRYKIQNFNSFEPDDNYLLKLGIANHNFRLFENKT